MSANIGNNQSCPITPKEAEKLMKSLEKIDERLSRIEQRLYAGRVVISVVVGMALAAAWVIEHAESLRQGVINWLKH